MLKSLDTLSRKNRIFTDSLCRLICCELKVSKPDDTWYDVQLPFYSGRHSGEISISGKTKISFKTSKEVLSERQIAHISNFILIIRNKNETLTMEKVRAYFAENLFNYSTTSALNGIEF